jgi:HSP20 family molecular chaperone IbpA
MNSQEVVRVPLRVGETIEDEIQDMYDEITRRAYDLFQQRGGDSTLDLEDWLTAERDVLDKPQVCIDETPSRIVIKVYLPHLTAHVELLVTPDAMLVRGPGSNSSRKLFRVVQFPRRIDAAKAEAQYADGWLVVTA